MPIPPMMGRMELTRALAEATAPNWASRRQLLPSLARLTGNLQLLPNARLERAQHVISVRSAGVEEDDEQEGDNAQPPRNVTAVRDVRDHRAAVERLAVPGQAGAFEYRRVLGDDRAKVRGVLLVVEGRGLAPVVRARGGVALPLCWGGGDRCCWCWCCWCAHGFYWGVLLASPVRLGF